METHTIINECPRRTQRRHRPRPFAPGRKRSCAIVSHTPAKTRVSGFRNLPVPRTQLDRSQSICLQRLTTPTPPETASGVPYYGYRFYSPELGRWVSRDPIGEDGGLNLFGFVENDSVSLVDILGLWGRDFHHGITLELAQRAGIACAEDVAINAFQPDRDERAAVRSVIAAHRLRMVGARQRARRRLQQAAEWHFPADPDGVVTGGSEAARAHVRRGIAECDFTLFSEGLHSLQDSWSHQGIPYRDGVGHSRGARRVIRRGVRWEHSAHYYYHPSVRFHIWYPSSGIIEDRWEPLEGRRAYYDRSASADNLEIFPSSARYAAIATYEKLLEFKEKCPCHCPGPSPTSSGPEQSVGGVADWLREVRLPGEDKI